MMRGARGCFGGVMRSAPIGGTLPKRPRSSIMVCPASNRALEARLLESLSSSNGDVASCSAELDALLALSEERGTPFMSEDAGQAGIWEQVNQLAFPGRLNDKQVEVKDYKGLAIYPLAALSFGLWKDEVLFGVSAVHNEVTVSDTVEDGGAWHIRTKLYNPEGTGELIARGFWSPTEDPSQLTVAFEASELVLESPIHPAEGAAPEAGRRPLPFAMKAGVELLYVGDTCRVTRGSK